MKAVLKITASEINCKGNWLKFCKEKGINEWAMNEGQMSGDEEFELTVEEARRYGLGHLLEERNG